jgi:glycosyltransferase involved in cell wall biosynthesis
MLILLFVFNFVLGVKVDILGPIRQADGIGQIAIGIFEAVKDEIKTFVFPNDYYFDDIPKDLKQNILVNLKNNYNKDVLLFTNIAPGYYCLENIINNYSLKIACSLFETDYLPDLWVNALNKFDLIIVNCDWLVNVYYKSGVNVPVYNLNIPLPTKDLVQKNINKSSNKFIFGMSAGPWRRKNHIKLITAFKETFKNNNNVLLKIHIRRFYELLSTDPKLYIGWDNVINYCKEIKKLIDTSPNIEIIGDVLTRKDYIEFISSLDCLVLPSAGEGFSIAPREALVLGIPTIISKNTAHLDLLDNPGVLFIPSGNEIPAVADFEGLKVGMQYDLSIKDISECLEKMYNNYYYYKKTSLKNNCENLKLSFSSLTNDYLTLIKPNKVILSNENKINSIDKILYTNSKVLFEKYKNHLFNK